MKRRAYSHWWLLTKLKIIGTYEKLLGKGIIPKKYFIRFLPDNPIILEAGAHKGKDTVEIARQWPSGTIYAFEPVPELFVKLTKNTRRFKNVHCYQLGLGTISGQQTMFISSGASDGSSSLLPPKTHLQYYPTVFFDNKIEVQITTLDDWAASHGIGHIDFMWLDLQGMELDVLKSGLHILTTIKAIYSEVSKNENYEGQGLYDELRDWLIMQGFYVAREEIANGNGNVLFVRN